MNRMPRTEVMMLGALPHGGYTPYRTNFINPPPAGSVPPRNLLRQTMLGGLACTTHVVAGLAGLGGVDDVLGESQGIDPNAIAVAPGQTAVLDAETNQMQHPSAEASLSLAERKLGFKVSLGMLSLSVLSGLASYYHGYKRDQRVMSGVGWGLLGFAFPVIVPVVAVAQGYGKVRKGR